MHHGVGRRLHGRLEHGVRVRKVLRVLLELVDLGYGGVLSDYQLCSFGTHGYSAAHLGNSDLIRDSDSEPYEVSTIPNIPRFEVTAILLTIPVNSTKKFTFTKNTNFRNFASKSHIILIEFY